jgi:hypothetical protein
MIVKLTCKKHPRYKVLRKPKAACSSCKTLWGLANFYDKDRGNIVLLHRETVVLEWLE